MSDLVKELFETFCRNKLKEYKKTLAIAMTEEQSMVVVRGLFEDAKVFGELVEQRVRTDLLTEIKLISKQCFKKPSIEGLDYMAFGMAISNWLKNKGFLE